MRTYIIIAVILVVIAAAWLVGFLMGRRALKRIEDIGFSNGVIAAVKCQQDPNCAILGPTDVKAGETKELGAFKMKIEEKTNDTMGSVQN